MRLNQPKTMPMIRLLTLSLCLTLFSSTLNAAAEANKPSTDKNQRYISENLEITMRAGKSREFKIIRMLRSGTPVTLLEVDKKTGYAHVVTASGKKGWVLIRYLSRHPSAKNQLKEAQKKLLTLTSEHQQQATALHAALIEKETLATNNQNNLAEKIALESEVTRIASAAKNALAIQTENAHLKKRLIQEGHQLQTSQQEVQALKNSASRQWFLTGAGVALLGFILGLIIPKLHWKRKSNWGSF